MPSAKPARWHIEGFSHVAAACLSLGPPQTVMIVVMTIERKVAGD
jgi:hypothetical protein